MAKLLVEGELMGASVESWRFWTTPLLRRMDVIDIVADCVFPRDGWGGILSAPALKAGGFCIHAGKKSELGN